MKVRFHLPDFAGKFRFNLVFTAMMKNCPHYFREGIEIASIDGVFPPSIWNGGHMQGGVCDKNFITAVLKTFNEKNISLRFTFTNPVLEKKHLNDKFCNMLMHLADNELNEVIVVSPILEKYIRNYYPKYKLVSSTAKRITDLDALKKEIESSYESVILDYDFNNRFELLEKIENKEKCEILINPYYQPNCEELIEYYNFIGRQQIAYCNHIKKYPNVPFDVERFIREDKSSSLACLNNDMDISKAKKLSTHITPDDIWNKYVPMGFSDFKIEGRNTSIFNLTETYLYYMIKPEWIDEARFAFLSNLQKNDVIIFNE